MYAVLPACRSFLFYGFKSPCRRSYSFMYSISNLPKKIGLVMSYAAKTPGFLREWPSEIP
jgi:hypothetical protein